MQLKVDLQKLESYSIALSEKLCNDYYQGNTSVIFGSEILKFTGIDQLNIFIVKNLFDRWKEESSKLRSPYFDYENEAVKDALTVFMNNLSKHISIRKEFFKPLVRKAIIDTLAYTIDPYHFLNTEFLGKPIISLSELMEKEKYIKINKFLLQGLVKKLQLQNKNGFSEQEVVGYLDETFKNYEPSLEPATRYVEAFSSILKITIEDITFKAIPLKEEKGAIAEPTPVLDSPKIEKEPAVNTFKKPPVDDHYDKNNATLNDSFAQHKQLSLNEMMRKDEENILSTHRKSKITDLANAVPINLRYIFINELFKGNADEYRLAITQIENSHNLESAKTALDLEFGKKYNWEKDKTEVKEFFELVERRFY